MTWPDEWPDEWPYRAIQLIEQLQEALEEYGNHKHDCANEKSSICSCGFKEAREL